MKVVSSCSCSCSNGPSIATIVLAGRRIDEAPYDPFTDDLTGHELYCLHMYLGFRFARRQNLPIPDALRFAVVHLCDHVRARMDHETP